MALKDRHPKMLPDILCAISDLKDISGCTAKSILNQVSTRKYSEEGRQTAKEIALQVRRALLHGTQTGLLVLKGGKYKIGDSDSVFGKIGNKNLPVKAAAGKQRRRRRRRRRRRPSSQVANSGNQNGNATNASEASSQQFSERNRKIKSTKKLTKRSATKQKISSEQNSRSDKS